MISMVKSIEPKSDRINADDLIGGRTLTIKITQVTIESGEQPIALHFENDGGKPFYPCKGMRRVLVNAWGSDGSKYIGKSLTLYRDDKVKFGGIEVGGLRISHLSHIDKEITMALTASKASRKPYTVKPLGAVQATPAPPTPDAPTEDLNAQCAALAKEIEMAESRDELSKIEKRCDELAAKLITTGKTKSHDKLLGILEVKRSEFSSTNPWMG